MDVKSDQISDVSRNVSSFGMAYNSDSAAERTSERCAVYIGTCDSYSDLWPGFFYCWRRYWPDCPYPVFLGANERTWTDPGITTLHSAPNTTWSQRIIDQLSLLDHEYVLFVLDDFFLRARVDGKRIADLISYLDVKRGGAVRLLPRPPPQLRDGDYPYVGECLPDTPYRICTQATIWRRLDFIGLLRSEENIWQFEMEGQKRGLASGKLFFSVYKTALPYRGLIFHHTVEKGKWLPNAYWRCRLKGIPCRQSVRPIMGLRPFFFLLMAEVIGRLFMAIFGGYSHVARERAKSLVPERLLRRYRSERKYPVIE
jgi:hypothetical protein